MVDPILIKRAEAERKWRAEMKQLGLETVRTRFTARLPVTDVMPYPDAKFVQDWLARQDRKVRARASFVTTLALIGTIAACIVAWPVVRDWFGH